MSLLGLVGIILISGCTNSTSNSVLPSKKNQVIRVIDGDTILVNTSTGKIRVRLLGIDTPETVHPEKNIQCFGNQASQKTKKLLHHKKIVLETDNAQKQFDKYGRKLAYVWLGKTLINYVLIKEGYAREYTYLGHPYKYQKKFRTAQKYAQTHHKGMWNIKNCPTPTHKIMYTQHK